MWQTESCPTCFLKCQGACYTGWAQDRFVMRASYPGTDAMTCPLEGLLSRPIRTRLCACALHCLCTSEDLQMSEITVSNTHFMTVSIPLDEGLIKAWNAFEAHAGAGSLARSQMRCLE